MSAHIEHLCDTFRRRVWILRHLKAANIDKEGLTRLYQVLVLPTLDYASTVYHSLLTQEQANTLEKLQARALKIIFGYKSSYTELLNISGVESLWDRRERMMDKFICKLVQSDRFRKDWLPEKEFIHHDLRQELFFHEKFARTDRLYKSPKYFIRRRLNEKRHVFIKSGEKEA